MEVKNKKVDLVKLRSLGEDISKKTKGKGMLTMADIAEVFLNRTDLTREEDIAFSLLLGAKFGEPTKPKKGEK